VIGESIAARYLSKRGFRVIARRLATPHGELDLVLRRGSLLVAAEVKSARVLFSPRPRGAPPVPDLRWRPGLRLRWRQVERQGRALAWLRRHTPWAAEARIDLVEVLVGPPHRITHAAGLARRDAGSLRWRHGGADDGLGGRVLP
jgi:putative endonuclease